MLSRTSQTGADALKSFWTPTRPEVGNWFDQVKFQEMYFCDVTTISVISCAFGAAALVRSLHMTDESVAPDEPLRSPCGKWNEQSEPRKPIYPDEAPSLDGESVPGALIFFV